VDQGPRLSLQSERRFELEPGDHEIVFSLQLADYSVREAVRVHLGSGEEQTITCPIRRPGILSVQAGLRSPQGTVKIDDRSLGSSPVRGVKLKPGVHRIAVSEMEQPQAPSIETTVEVQSGKETVVTFDLTDVSENGLQVRMREGAT